ncbi:pilus assembly protein CpaB [Shewanella sp. D64]|uniref:RcpC/CpaB family pilus assembly protein n=1 Tax=unclassified Shewanella TaxID=196818 RepID=UPI0022BA1686|nr:MULTISPECIES: RcpC/CpaB family pilus assembly protein [unclassified Shewanella]MEC4725704.1 pilus assembly protein CpaB [Shewanella sp. D64]MEC4737689.1 pilus assembly protein CpaB [Shewanella sp. E94]WBJ93496.1 pilus assembly protein CpaB [Shewanella sp. MTB7]
MINSKLIFTVAFIALLTGLYGVADKLLSTPEAVAQPASIEELPTTYVLWQVKASHNKGSTLSLADVQKVQLGEKEAQTLGINADVELNLGSQTLLNSSLVAGQYLFPEQLTHPGELGYLSLITREGMTLYPLSVATNNMIQDYIRPGDEIDIMTLSSPEYNLANDTQHLDDFSGLRASILMKKVRVISVVSAGLGAKSSGVNPSMKSSSKAETRIVIEVYPDDLPRLTLAQRTMHIEVYHSQTYGGKPEVGVSDVIKNYTGVVELRGASANNIGGIF